MQQNKLQTLLSVDPTLKTIFILSKHIHHFMKTLIKNNSFNVKELTEKETIINKRKRKEKHEKPCHQVLVVQITRTHHITVVTKGLENVNISRYTSIED